VEKTHSSGRKEKEFLKPRIGRKQKGLVLEKKEKTLKMNLENSAGYRNAKKKKPLQAKRSIGDQPRGQGHRDKFTGIPL